MIISAPLYYDRLIPSYSIISYFTAIGTLFFDFAFARLMASPHGSFLTELCGKEVFWSDKRKHTAVEP